MIQIMENALLAEVVLKINYQLKATKMQGQITSGTNCIAQRAAITAVLAPVSKVQYMVDEFKSRRNIVLELLGEIEGFKLNIPDGAFYVFPNISYFFGKTIKGK